MAQYLKNGQKSEVSCFNSVLPLKYIITQSKWYGKGGGGGNCATSIRMPEMVSKIVSSPEKKEPENDILFSKSRFLPKGIFSLFKTGTTAQYTSVHEAHRSYTKKCLVMADLLFVPRRHVFFWYQSHTFSSLRTKPTQ